MLYISDDFPNRTVLIIVNAYLIINTSLLPFKVPLKQQKARHKQRSKGLWL